jgi:hypothetical protein
MGLEPMDKSELASSLFLKFWYKHRRQANVNYNLTVATVAFIEKEILDGEPIETPVA